MLSDMTPVARRITTLQHQLGPLLEFLNHSEHSRRIGDPTIADFVQNNVTPAWDEFQAPPVPPVTIVVR